MIEQFLLLTSTDCTAVNSPYLSCFNTYIQEYDYSIWGVGVSMDVVLRLVHTEARGQHPVPSAVTPHLIFFFFYFMCMSVCLHVCMCTVYVEERNLWRSEERIRFSGTGIANGCICASGMLRGILRRPEVDFRSP